MSSILYNIEFLRESLDELERYLLSEDLYGRLHAKAPAGEPPFASLTLGNVLLARKELLAASLTGEQAGLFQAIDGKLEALRSKWRAAWDEKAKQEYPARLRQWGFFLNELHREPEKQADRYAYEVRRRVIVELLGQESQSAADENHDKLFMLDELLKRDFIEGEFVWDEGMSEGFPKSVYWYLWGRAG